MPSVPTVSRNFFIGAILDFLYHPMLLPLIAPTEGRTTAYTLSLGFGNEELGLELVLERNKTWRKKIGYAQQEPAEMGRLLRRDR